MVQKANAIWYRVLNYHSDHVNSTQINTSYELLRRALSLSSSALWSNQLRNLSSYYSKMAYEHRIIKKLIARQSFSPKWYQWNFWNLISNFGIFPWMFGTHFLVHLDIRSVFLFGFKSYDILNYRIDCQDCDSVTYKSGVP